jgi:MFS family permease
MGVYFGMLIGGLSGYAADSPSIGWQSTFKYVGIAGIVYAIPLLIYLRDPPRFDDNDAIREKPSVTMSLRVLLTNVSFLLLVAYFTFPAMAGWIVRDWMPSILQDSFSIGQGLAGFSASFYWQITAIFAAIIGGILADRWMRRNIRGRIYISAVGMMFLIPSMVCVGAATTFNTFSLAIVALVLFGIGWGLFDCNNMPILCQIVRPEYRATGYGLMNLVSLFCGGIADWVFGLMRDLQVPQFIIFGFFAGIAALSAVLVLLIRPRTVTELSG